MPTVPIDILFAGLMIFVPSSTSDPSSMAVYLLKEDHHIPVLTINGDLCLESGNGKCSDTLGPCKVAPSTTQQGRSISCDLKNIKEITFNPTIDHSPRFLRPGPPQRPPQSLSERGSFAWLPRVLSFERGDAQARTPSELLQRVGAHLEIGWESAQACELDGGEENQVKIFDFIAQNASPSPQQALAEAVLFTAEIEPGPFRIHLLDGTNKDTVIRASCGGAKCVSMQVDNTLCDGCQLPDHFKMYYDLANNAKVKRYPHYITKTPTGECYDHLWNECWLRLQKPIHKDLVALTQKNPNRRTTCTADALKRYLYQAFVAKEDSPAKRQKKKDELQGFIQSLTDDIRKVQDRIVCPPVMLEP
jgi:hypothetical protein